MSINVELSKKQFLDLYESIDRTANFMAIEILKKQEDLSPHDRGDCDAVYYPYYEDYEMPPTLVCLNCMRIIE